MQSYLKREVLSCDEKKTTNYISAKCVRTMKTHFKKMYINVLRPLLCLDSEDAPDHLFTCTKLIHEDLGKLNMM